MHDGNGGIIYNLFTYSRYLIFTAESTVDILTIQNMRWHLPRLLLLVLLVSCGIEVDAVDDSVLSKDLYKILGLKKGCSQKDIKKAYRKLAQVHHPDKNLKNKEANESIFLEIAEAYEVLSNTEQREEYDALRAAKDRRRTNKSSRQDQSRQNFQYQVF